MINSKQWEDTVPGSNLNKDEKNYNLDPQKWVNTLPKKNKKNFTKSFSITLAIFLVGLIFVSVIKNKTRSLEKEINALQASINNLKIDLNLTKLDYEVITSPENLSKLAKKHLEFELHSYKKSQIRNLYSEEKVVLKVDKNENEGLSPKAKSNITKKYKKKLKKVKELYSEPEKIPDEVKITVASKFEEKKQIVKRIYNNPRETITAERLQRWGAIQVVKAFLGIPIVPGK